MNKYLFLIMTTLMITAQKAFCLAEVVETGLDESLKTQTGEPNFLSILASLIFVIFLIYITGVIYSKLNVVGTKTVKEHLRHSNLNKAIVISTTQLGQNKNLHVIEINDKCYLIGATPNSINLLKELGSVKENFKDEPQKPNEEEIDKAIQVLYGGNKVEIEPEVHDDDEFNVHKKYL